MTTLRLYAVLLVWPVLLATAWPAAAQGGPSCPLGPGGSPFSFSLPDNDGIMHSPEQFKGRVLIVNHADPDHRDTNEAVSDAVKQAVESGRLAKELLVGLGIADCQASWLPNSLIRAYGKFRSRKYGSAVLYDYTGEVRRCWGLPPRTSTIVILDKSGICRFIESGKLDPAEIPRIIDLLAALEREPKSRSAPGPGDAAQGRPIEPMEY
jgi:predicted transcriptional regulator